MARKHQITEEHLKTIFNNWKDLQPRDLEKVYALLIDGRLNHKVKYYLFKIIIENTIQLPSIIKIESIISNDFVKFLKTKLTKQDEINLIEYIKISYKNWFHYLSHLFALERPAISSVCENLLLEITVESNKNPKYLGYYGSNGLRLIEEVLDGYKNANRRNAFIAAFEVYKTNGPYKQIAGAISTEFNRFIKKYPEFEKYAALI